MTSYTISWLDEALLKFLTKLKSVRVTGSFARHEPNNNSDLDIKLNERDLAEVKRYLQKANLIFNSELPGHITYEGVEFYIGFNKQKTRKDSVTINGQTFKTW